MITREEMIGLLQILADLPSAETKQGRGVRRRVEEAIAALQAGRQSQQAQEFTDYDTGALNDWGGGDVGWWQDYIRSEIERANDHWREQTGPEPLGLAPPAPAAVPNEAFNLIEAIRAELTWPGWRKTSSRDRVMDMVSELLSMLIASPHPAETFNPSRIGYAGVTVWVGDLECTKVVGSKHILEASKVDVLRMGFEEAREAISARQQEGEAER